MELTTLERDIISWLRHYCDDADVQCQLPHLELQKREYTGVGYFLHFTVSPRIATAPESEGDVTPFAGPNIASSKLESGAGTAIFLTNGKIDCIEIFTYGVSFPEHLMDYTLS